jgi:hypothetical protein
LTFALHQYLEENDMKKLGFAIAALGAIVIALPSIASAETVIIKRGGHHHGWDRSRAEYRMHRDFRPMHRHHDRVVIVKRHRY